MISKKAENLIKMCDDEDLSGYVPNFIILDNSFFIEHANFNLQESVKNFLNSVSKEQLDRGEEIVQQYRRLVDELSIDTTQLQLGESISYCVRSSFFEDMDNLSFTGRFESILGVRIPILEAAIKQVIKSYYSLEMIEMYDTIVFNEEFEPTVIIQEMKGRIDKSGESPVLSACVLEKIQNIASSIEERIIKGPSDIELLIEEGNESYSGVLFTVDPRNGNDYLTLRLTSGVGTAVGKAEQEQIYYISKHRNHNWVFYKEKTENYLNNPDIWVVQSRKLKVSKYEKKKNLIDTSNYKAIEGDIISSSDRVFDNFLVCADLKTAWSVWLNSNDKNFSIAVQNGSLLEHEAILLREKNVFVCKIHLSKLVDLQYVKAFFDTNRSMFYFLDEKQIINTKDCECDPEEALVLQIISLRDLMISFARQDIFDKAIHNCDNFLLDYNEYDNNLSLIRNILEFLVVDIAAIVLNNNIYSKQCEKVFSLFREYKVIQNLFVEWIMNNNSKQFLAQQYKYDKDLIRITVESTVDNIAAAKLFSTYLSNKDLDIQDQRIIFRHVLKYKDDAFFDKNCNWKCLCNKVHCLEIDINTFFKITENIFGPWFFDYFLSLDEWDSKRIGDRIFRREFIKHVFVELSEYYKSNEMLLLKDMLIRYKKQIYSWFQEFYEDFCNTILMNSIFSILSESYDLACKVCLTNIHENIEEYQLLLTAWIDILVFLNNSTDFDDIAKKSIMTVQEFICDKEICNYDVDIDDFWINVVENREITNLHILHNVVHQLSLYLIENYFKLNVQQKEYVEIYYIINLILGQRSQFINSIFGHTELQLSLSQHKSSVTYLPNQIILRYMSAQGTEEICTKNRNKAIIYWLQYIECDDIYVQYQDIKSGSSSGLYVSIQGDHIDYGKMRELTFEIITILSALAGFSLLLYPYEIQSEFNGQQFIYDKLLEYSRTKYNVEYKVGYKSSPQSYILTEVGMYPELYNCIGQGLSYTFECFVELVKDKVLNAKVCDKYTGQIHSWWLMSMVGLMISMIYPDEAFQAITQHRLDKELSEDAICKHLFMNKRIVEKAISMYRNGNKEIANYLVRYAPEYMIQLWRNKEVDIMSFLEVDEQINGILFLCFAALELETLCTDSNLQFYFNKYLVYCEEHYKDRYRLCDSDLGAIYISRASYEYLMKTNDSACTKLKNALKKNLVIDCNQFDYTYVF